MSRQRLSTIDLLRGLAILLMAVDHSRDFFQPSGASPTDLDTTALPFFLTRWITHFCAPVFVLLAGSGSRLYRDRVGAAATARFLATRGLWLMFLEVTWISFSWYFSFKATELGVVWGIGGAMLLLAPFVWMRGWALGLLGAGITLVLAWHGWPAESVGADLFGPTVITLGEHTVHNVYAIVPWLAVLALGYALATLFREARGQRVLAMLGVGFTVGFLVLRGLNSYGDPTPWEPHARGMLVTAMDFLDPGKYPPSLDYQLMTLGPALAVVPLLSRWRGRTSDAVRTVGRVPLFFYLLHLPLLHAMGWLHAWMRWGTARPPADSGLSYLAIYGAWVLALAILWWPCKRWDVLKSGRRYAWIRYL